MHRVFRISALIVPLLQCSGSQIVHLYNISSEFVSSSEPPKRRFQFPRLMRKLALASLQLPQIYGVFYGFSSQLLDQLGWH